MRFFIILVPRFGGRDRGGRGREVIACPRCRQPERSFFRQWKPLTGKPLWRCRNCRMKYKVKAGAYGASWGAAFFLYSLPLTLLLGVGFFAALFLRDLARTGTWDPGPVLGGLLCGGPALALVGSLFFWLIGYFIGLFYGVHATLND